MKDLLTSALDAHGGLLRWREIDPVRWQGIVIPALRRAVGRTPKGAVLSGPTGVLLQMSDIKLIPNAPKEKSND